MASSSSSICPFTLKPIADVSSDDLAVIHHTNLSTACGRCTLSKLISYLHDGARECPLCRTSTVGTVYDGGSAEYISRQVNDESDSCQPMSCDKGRIVSFKYGAVSYHLWVTSDQIVLNRISSIMGIDINNLKIIHRGKLLYPSTSIIEASEQILDISHTDMIHKRKKPSLILMGIRQQPTNIKLASTNSSGYALLKQVVAILSPWSIYNNIQKCAQLTWQTIRAVFRGIYIFISTVLSPPDTRANL